MTSQVVISNSDELKAFLRVAGSAAANEETVDLDSVCALVLKFNADHPNLDPFDLSKLLAECTVVGRKKVGRETETELERLRRVAEEKRYQRMIKTGDGPALSFSAEIKTLAETAHFISAFIGAFLFGFFATRIFCEWSINHAAAAGGAAAIVTLVLETVLLIIRDGGQRKAHLKVG